MSDPNKLSVIHALHDFSKRTQEIIDRIGDRTTIGTFERGELQGLYSRLKEDRKEAAQLGKVSAERREQSEWERYYFAPAVMKAANSLRARTNSNPTRSNWRGSFLNAASECSYYLDQLEKDYLKDR